MLTRRLLFEDKLELALDTACGDLRIQNKICIVVFFFKWLLKIPFFEKVLLFS